MAESIDKLPGLHALRMTAAVAVFVLHTVFYTANFVGPVFKFTGTYFALSVQLFYLVSAFALMHSTRVYEHQHDWIKRFYLKRFWRIAPLFYALAIALTTYKWLRRGASPSLTEIALNAAFLNNFDARYVLSLTPGGWSVSVEVLFYLTFPLIFVYIRSLKAAAVLTAASIIVAQVARIYLEKIPVQVPTALGGMENFGSMADFSIATNIPYFSMGVVAYLVYQRLLKMSWANPDAAPSIAILCHATFVMSIAGLVAVIDHFNPWMRAHGRADQLLWGAIFTLLAIWVTVRPLALFSWAPIQFLGERSYSIYLLHPYLILLLKPVAAGVLQSCQPRMGEWAMAPTLAVVFVPLVLLAAATYALIEKPGMDVGRWLRTRLKPRRAVVPHAALE